MQQAILVALSLVSIVGCHEKADAPDKTKDMAKPTESSAKPTESSTKPTETTAKPTETTAPTAPSGWSVVDLRKLKAPDPSEAMNGTIAPHAPWNQTLSLPPNATAVRKVSSDKYDPTGEESIAITAGNVELSFNTSDAAPDPTAAKKTRAALGAPIVERKLPDGGFVLAWKNQAMSDQTKAEVFNFWCERATPRVRIMTNNLKSRADVDTAGQICESVAVAGAS